MSVIRAATPADAPALAALKLATFRETFVEDFAMAYPAADLARFETETYGLAAITAQLLDPLHQSWVASELDGELSGYLHLGPCKLPHPDVQPGDPEICQLYLRRHAQGRGLGRALLDLALERLGDKRPVWLGVWTGNARARAIYAARGFVEVGAYRFAVGDWFDDEIIMRHNPR